MSALMEIKYYLILRSSNKNLLIVPDIRSEMGSQSFSFAAPSIWNSFPQHIRYLFLGVCSRLSYIKSLYCHRFQ